MEVYFIDIATTLLREAGVAGDMLHLLSTCMVVACALFVAWLLFWLLTHYLIPVVEKFTNFTSAKWDDILLNPRLLRVVAELLVVILCRPRCLRLLCIMRLSEALFLLRAVCCL